MSPDSSPTKGDRTRQALLEAAIVRFAREGYRGTSVADVCRDAGMSTTASYPYFPNKEALFVAAVDEDVAGLIADAVSLVAIDEQPDAWGSVLMQALADHMPGHPLAGRIVRGLEPEFTMRLLHIPALQELRKTVTELIRHEQSDGRVRQDIDPGQTANGMVVIVISLLMATMQTGADTEGYTQVAADVESVLQAATRPPAASNESAARPEIRTSFRAAASLLRAPSSRPMGIVRGVRSGRPLPSRGARGGRRGGKDLVVPTNDHPISPRCLRGMPRFTCPPDGIDPVRRIRAGSARHLPGHLAQPWQRALWLLAGCFVPGCLGSWLDASRSLCAARCRHSERSRSRRVPGR